MTNIISLIVSSDFLYSENIEVLDRTLNITANLIQAAGPLSKKHLHGLFKILLQLGSLPNMTAYKEKVDKTLHELAVNCGYEDASDLFSVELAALLADMKESYEKWDKNTPERYIFDILVKRASTAVVDYWEDILFIIAANVENDKDYEIRMDMLALVEHLLQSENLHSTIPYYSEIILKMILLPST